MAKKKNWTPYHLAAQRAQEAGCKSRRQFMDWHKENGIKDIPKQPDRVYSEWDGWPAFLDTGNVFAADKDSETAYRPYWEAVRWTQMYCSERDITTGQGWKHAFAADRERRLNEIPADIPKHPENFYKEDWTGWPAWLGKGVQEKIAAQRAEISLFCLATASYRAPNIISAVVAKDGESQLLDLLYQKSLTPMQIYKFEKELAPQMEQAIRASSTLQPDGAWICRNVHQLRSDLDFILEIHTPTNTEQFKKLASVQRADPNDGFDVEEKAHLNKVSLTNGPSNFI